jgi:pimeloyl-ACP methyl ester carboxylesterase
VTLVHRIDGHGPPLVLLNGGFMTIASWEQLAKELSSIHRVIRCDFRGQLLTPGPYAESIDEHAADILALLDFLGIERAQLAGPSFGAEVAMLLAARAPARVDRLTVITATERTTETMRRKAHEARLLAEQAAAGRREAAEQLLRRVLEETWSEQWLARQPEDFVQARVAQFVALPPAFFDGAASMFHILETLDLTAELGRIAAPTMVIGGELDRVFPPEHSRAIAAAIPGAGLEIIAGAGHGLIIERADRVVELLCRPQ